MAAIRIENVWKYYGETAAVKDLNLECADGEFLCVLGPSGCGKSSTLRMLAGLEHISAGDVFFGDRRVNDLPPKDRKIAMVFENYALYPHKTIFQNMANALRIAKLSNTEIKQRVHKAAELLQISELLDRKPSELSGGQKQRTAIGRAIVREPELFLFDEPIAHLDAKLRAHMRSELKVMQRKLNTSMIYVTHDQLEALSMADRIAIMNEGVLQQVASPTEIYNNPVNQWVAGFIGEPAMNFLPCDLADEGGSLRLKNDSFSLDLTPETAHTVRQANAPKAVVLGVRPDDITIRPDESAAAIKSEVVVTKLLGGDMLVEAAIRDNRITVKTSPDYQTDMGDVAYVTFNTNRLHLFSASTGLSLLS